MDKDKEIKKRLTKLKEIFKDEPDDKRDLCEDLMSNAAFMGASLKELQDKINKDGMVSDYQNGANQWGTKKSPEVEIYSSMIKQYCTVIKQLIEMVPDGAKDDELTRFLKERR